jgi:hypothetical protein
MTQSLANVESYNVAAAQAQAAKYGVAETLKSIMEQTHVQKLFLRPYQFCNLSEVVIT